MIPIHCYSSDILRRPKKIWSIFYPFFLHYLVTSNYKRKMGQIFVWASQNIWILSSFNKCTVFQGIVCIRCCCWTKHLEKARGIQQLRGQNFAIFWPPPPAWAVLYPERRQKPTYFDPLPPHLVHVVIDWPLGRNLISRQLFYNIFF